MTSNPYEDSNCYRPSSCGYLEGQPSFEESQFVPKRQPGIDISCPYSQINSSNFEDTSAASCSSFHSNPTTISNCNFTPAETTKCSTFGQCTYNSETVTKDSLFNRLLNSLKCATFQRSHCPLKEEHPLYKPFANTQGEQISHRTDQEDIFSHLHELYNPATYRRWELLENWDQNKEKLWKDHILTKVDCMFEERGLQAIVKDTLKALYRRNEECVSFRILYNLLKRNEDLQLLQYLSGIDDDLFLKLILSFNRFYNEDKDVRKSILNNPLPSTIEKIMMRVTLYIIDPTSTQVSIARRFWELLLSWYAEKLKR